MKEKEYNWYRLDTTARLYPAILDTRDSTFRLSMELLEEVDPEILQKALEKTLPRFPTFEVKLKPGLFWYYFEYNENTPPVEPESKFPCSRIYPDKNKEFLFKVLYFKNRISLEVFHSITDGLGGMEFFKSLVFEYLKIKGYPVEGEGLIKMSDESPKPYEAEDSFEKYYNRGKKRKHAGITAYHIEGVAYPRGEQNVVHGVVDVDEMLAAARRYGVKLTTFLAAVMIYAIYRDQRLDLGEKKPVRIMVPVNLRRMFPSGTLRNFISHYLVGVRFEQEVSFEDVVAQLAEQLKQVATKTEMSAYINSNVDVSKNIMVKIAPLHAKNMGLRAAYQWYGEKLYTTIVSNLAVIRLPASMTPHVKSISCAMGATDMLPIKMTACTYNGKLDICFTRCIMEADIIKEFFRFLTKEQKMKVEIYGNGWREEQ
jgi:NRPS condensation-like uncharacterized protein